MRALTFLNISHNRIGDLVLPEGWTKGDSGYPDFGKYKHTDGRKQDRAPEGSKPDGVIAVANAIKNLGALTSLNLSSNLLCGMNQYGEGTYDASGNTNPVYYIP